MTRRQTMWRIAFVVALVWFTTVPAATGKDRKPSKESSHNGEQYSRPTDPSLYVGAETCKTCHEDIFKNFETTPHWKTTFTKKGRSGKVARLVTAQARSTLREVAIRARFSCSKASPQSRSASAAWVVMNMERNTPTSTALSTILMM